MMRQSTGAATASDGLDEAIDTINTAAQPAIPNNQPMNFMSWLQNNVQKGLPSAQAAMEASRKRFEASMAPEEFSPIDNFAMAAGTLKPEMMQQGNLGMALAQLGGASAAGRQKFNATEQAKSKALLDEDQANLKTQMDAATKLQAAQARSGKSAALAKNLDSAATQFAMQQLKDLGGNMDAAQRDELFSKSYKDQFMRSVHAASAAGGMDDQTYTELLNNLARREAAGFHPPSAPRPTTDGGTPFAVELGNDAASFSALRDALTGAARSGDKKLHAALSTVMADKFPKGRESIVSTGQQGFVPMPETNPTVAVPQASTPSATGTTKYGSELNQKVKIAGGEADAKAAVDLAKTDYEANINTPYQAANSLHNTTKNFMDIMSKATAAEKSGKGMEILAGPVGSWAAMLAPKDSPLYKNIVTAQTADQLSASMVQAILQAAKGVQTEGDADRAKTQVVNVGKSADANEWMAAYIKETYQQQSLKKQAADTHRESTGSLVGHDKPWRSSVFMVGSDGVKPDSSVKYVNGRGYMGLSEYLNLYKTKAQENGFEGNADRAALVNWNKLPATKTNASETK
jgi:hypothetical protein